MDLQTKPVSRSLDFSLTSVNIVFLLLLFFLTAGTLLQDVETEITAPLTEKLPLGRLPRPLLAINQHGALFLDGKTITVEQLLARGPQQQISELTPDQPLPVLHVMPDQTLAANRFLDIIKSIRAAGTWNITLVTIRDNKGAE